jgi:hypothetical protein
MVVKTWSGTETEIAWFEISTWWRWALGHLRSVLTRRDRALRRMVRADVELGDHLERCPLCDRVPVCAVGLELDAEAAELRREYRARYGVA